MKKQVMCVAAVALAVAITATVRAGDGTWTLNGNSNWSVASSWQDGIIANGTDYTADFSTINITNDRTVTLDSDRTIGHLRFSDIASAYYDWTLSGSSTLNMDTTTGPPTITVVREKATIDVVLAGNDGLTKAGGGTLALGNASNNYTGTTTVSAGTLQLRISNVIPDASSVAIASGATLDMNLKDETIDALSGTGTVTNNAAGTSTLTVGSNGGSGTFSGVIKNGSSSDIVAVTKTGSGTQTLSGANAYTGATTVNAGTLAYGANDVIYTGAVTVNGATAVLSMGSYTDTVGTVTVDGGGQITGTGTLTVNSASTFEMKSGTVSAKLAGSAGLNKTTTGTVTLTGANSYTGLTTVGTGVLNIQNGTALGTTAGATTITSGATLQIQGGISVGAESLTVRGKGSTGQNGAFVNVSGINTYGGLLTLDAASTISSDSGTLVLSNTGTITGAGHALTLTGAGNGSIASIIGTGTGTLTKSGTGTWTLSGANTYTGNTTISGGILVAGHASALGGSTTSVNSGGTLAVASGITLDKAATWNSGSTLAGLGTYRPAAASFSVASGVRVAPGIANGTNNVGTLAIGYTGSAVNTTFASGSYLDIDLNGANADRLNVVGTVTVNSGANLTFNTISAPTAGKYTLLTASSGTFSNNFTATAPAGYRLAMGGANNELLLIHRATIGTITAQTGLELITGGSVPFTFTVQNSAPLDSDNLSASATAGTNVSGFVSGPIVVAAGSTSSAISGFSYTGTTVGLGQTGSFQITDANASNSPRTGTVTVNVYAHAAPSLHVTSGDNFRVMRGASGVTAGLALSNASGVRAKLDVLSLGSGVSGATGAKLVAPGGFEAYTAAIDTSTAGAYSHDFTINVRDEDLPGRGAASDVSANVTGAVVENRVVSASAVNVGRVLLGHTVLSNLATTGDNNHYTAVTVATTAAANADGVSVTGGTGILFNGAASVGNRTLLFAVSGAKSGAITLVTTGEGLPGESPVDVSVSYTATVYEAASLTANTGTVLGPDANVSIANAAPAGALRADAVVDSVAFSNARWALDNLGVGSAISAGSGTPTAAVRFDSSGLLNTTYRATLRIYLENDQTIAGASNRDLNGGNPYVWGLSATVTGNSGVLACDVELGAPFDGIYGISDQAGGTIATLLDGDAGAARSLGMAWREPSPGEAPAGLAVLGDIVELTGTGTDMYVLQMSYNPALLPDPAAEVSLAVSGGLFLGWFDTTASAWVNAVMGNSDGGVGAVFAGNVAYNPSYFSLGTWGVDTDADVVWAVLDHNSEFGVLFQNQDHAPVPEPGVLGLMGLALLGLRRRSIRR